MNFRRTLQFLSLPAALGLGTALVIACTDSGPTESTMGQEQVQAPQPMAVPKKGGGGGGALDATGNDINQCPAGYHLESVNPGSGADDNNDGYICKKGVLKKK